MTISCKRFSPTICLSKLSYKQDAKVLKGHPTLRLIFGRTLWGYQESTSKLPGCHHGHDNGARPEIHPESQTPQQKRSGSLGKKKGTTRQYRSPRKNTPNILETQLPYMQPFSRALVLLSERRFYVTTIQLMLTSPYSP